MLGAIVGDVIGSVYEWNNHRSKAFDLYRPDRFFTDDTVLTVATADAIMSGGDLGAIYRRYTRDFPDRGYGGRYSGWAASDDAGPYNSFGNGSAMRASPAGWAAASLDEALQLGRWSAEVTHNHPEGIKGAQAVAAAVYLARTGADKADVREAMISRFAYDLSFTIDEIRPTYRFNESCQETVPQAIVAFLESTDFEDAIRTAVSVGGDTDTLACITGSIAEAFYGSVPDRISRHVMGVLDGRLISVVERFREKHVRA